MNYRMREYKVKYKADRGDPYMIEAATARRAAQILAQSSPATDDAIILVYDREDKDPLEFYIDELKPFPRRLFHR